MSTRVMLLLVIGALFAIGIPLLIAAAAVLHGAMTQ